MDQPAPPPPAQPKKWLFVPFLLAALGVPYAVMEGKGGKWFGGEAKQAAYPLVGEDPAQLNLAGYAGQGGAPVAAAPQLGGPRVADFGEVIRFDISPRWVAQNWARVSTVSAELDLEALRVPLVTGPRPDDLAGSLTYYFDKHHAVKRITFYGSTGDERRLLMLLGTVYGFREQPALGGGMYVTTWNGKPVSVLRVMYSPVVSASAPHAQKELNLEINRPGEFTSLSDEMRHLLDRDQASRRW